MQISTGADQVHQLCIDLQIFLAASVRINSSSAARTQTTEIVFVVDVW